MKQQVVIIIVFILLIITAIASTIIFDWDNDLNNQLIGGEKDVQGCLISAGYTFDKGIGACTRGWEIDESNEKMAAKIAVESTNKNSLTVENVNPIGCEGCFVVSLNNKDEKELVYLNDWKVIDKNIISVAECTIESGRIVDTSFDLDCNENEENLGCIDNCMNSLICCVGNN